jgi:acetylornithine deacetylase/succinyl-diaminopimelate desuccinylase-like protein
MTAEMLSYLDASQEELKQLIRDLCAIPAPSHHEEKRAEFCKKWFESVGAKGVFIDEALNVVCPHYVTDDGPVTVFMAHTDTVFPDTEPMPFVETADTFQCPGVCDDTGNLAVMMLCAKYFIQNDIPGKTGIVFVANSCEEGLGNLKGCRAIAARYGKRMERLVTFDGYLLNMVASHAVGSHRYQVTVKTEGGHSFGDFGNRNAIAVLSGMINALYSVKVPTEPGSKTTYNVGSISGGTSVNTICQEATMLYEYRSDNHICLEKMRQMFEAVIAAYRAMGLDIEVQLLGERPCAANVDEAALEKLKKLAADSVLRITGQEAKFVSASTDCNIPLSLGIPSVCMGVCVGSGLHTRGEVLQLSSLPQGSALCMDFLCNFF